MSGPTASSAVDPRRGAVPARSASADALVPIAGRGAGVLGPGPAAAAARRPGPRHPHPLLAGGPLAASSACAACSGLARDVLLPATRRARARSATAPSDPWSPASSAAGGRPLGRPAHRRHPRRVGGRHVGRRHLPAPAGRRGSDGAASCASLRAEIPPPDPDAPPLFWALDGGMGALIDALADGSRGARGGHPHRRARRRRLDRRGGGWTVVDRPRARTTPTRWSWPCRRRWPRCCARTTTKRPTLLDAVDYASVTLVTFRVADGSRPRVALRHRFPGAPAQRRPGASEGWVVTACTFLSRSGPTCSRTASSCSAPRSGATATDRPRTGTTPPWSSGSGTSWAS